MLLAGLSLSACGKAETDDLTLPQNSKASGRMEDQFGKEFGEAFRADPNSTPANVSESDVVPVSLDTEPVPID
ncbi:MAG: hypothetical protein ABIU10_07620 [Sphingomicrobium sp.]